MKDSQPIPTRQTWFIIFGAITFSAVIYCVLGFLIEQNQTPRTVNAASVAQMRPLIVGAADAMLVASMGWFMFRVNGKIGGEGREVALTPGQFQSASIVALALSEGCVILGLLLFFIGAPLKELVFFAAGTLLLNFVFILPRGLQFWATYERDMHR